MGRQSAIDANDKCFRRIFFDDVEAMAVPAALWAIFACLTPIKADAAPRASHMRHAQSAEHFAKRGSLSPSDNKRLEALVREAEALFKHGDEIGDNAALVAAIDRWKKILDLRPLDRALAENKLANALRVLGERESGTTTLQQAVAVIHAALKEFRRERAPLQWAMTQNNLGNALLALGEREKGPATLQQAISAYRDALRSGHESGLRSNGL